MTLRLRYAVRSHVGHVRDGNEDSAYAGSRLAVVADGMGGHAAGEVASSAVVAVLAHLDDDEAGTDLLGELSAAIEEANTTLREMVESNSALVGMGTTVTALLASGSRLGVAHVGDSRAYLLREGELSLVTRDQTLVQRLVDEGRITTEQADVHPQRALLTQALDGHEGVEPDLSLREGRQNDRYLLCSDGLSGVVQEETITEALTLQPAEAAAERLVELALRGGGPDNVTVVVADVVEDSPGLSDVPLVAGAAAEKDAVPGASRVSQEGGLRTSAASRARRLLPARLRGGAAEEAPPAGATPAAGAGPASIAPSRRRPRGFLTAVTAAGTLVLVVVLGGSAYAYTRTQWYVGADAGRVAVFRGVPVRVLGVRLSSVVEHYQSLDQLPEYQRQQVQRGLTQDDRASAESLVSRLTAPAALPPGPAAAVTSSPSPSPRPSVTGATPGAGGAPGAPSGPASPRPGQSASSRAQDWAGQLVRGPQPTLAPAQLVAPAAVPTRSPAPRL